MVTRMDRREAVDALLANRGEALVVTGLGSPTYDVHAVGDRDDNYYLWGAMGGAALVGLGLAQAQPDRRVMVVTGDGEQLMAMGALATIAVAKPVNLDILVVDNRHFGETGMQTSHTGEGVALEAVAAACAGVDGIFHEAAQVSVPQSIEDPVGSYEVNVTGTLRVLEGARAAGLPAERVAADTSWEKIGEQLLAEVRSGDQILVKGSRAMRMERIVDLLTRAPEDRA